MLEAHQLAKSYATHPAVAGVSLHVAPGEMLALLGPNGAGKSTTLGMLAGLIAPDAGDVRIGEANMADAPDTCKARIGLVPQDIALFEELTARINLEIVAGLYGIDGPRRHRCVAEALELVGLADRAGERVSHYSGGMKRRLNIAAALLHDPDIVLLDEPTVGVDPQSRHAIFENLEQLKARGKALIYSTHYMEEAERLADRIVILDHGKVLAAGTLAELNALAPAASVLDLSLAGEIDTAPLCALPGVNRIETLPNGHFRLRIVLDTLDAAAGVLTGVAAHGGRIVHLASERASLESLFLQLTGRALRD